MPRSLHLQVSTEFDPGVPDIDTAPAPQVNPRVSSHLSHHGSPADRGSADAWYGRPPRPHKRIGPYASIEFTDLTAEEVAEYHAGFEGECAAGNFGEGRW